MTEVEIIENVLHALCKQFQRGLEMNDKIKHQVIFTRREHATSGNNLIIKYEITMDGTLLYMQDGQIPMADKDAHQQAQAMKLSLLQRMSYDLFANGMMNAKQQISKSKIIVP